MADDKMTLIAQETSPRCDDENGVDYGRDGKVLARRGHLSLVWQPGGRYWSGWHGNSYAPSHLEVRGLPGHRIGVEIAEGGRLSAALIAGHSARIDEYFGVGAAKAINTKKTLAIEPVMPEGEQR